MQVKEQHMHMRKPTLSALIAAGIVAVAGAAQAGTFDSPTQAGEASTMTHGVPNAATTNSPYPDGYNATMVMGAGPVLVDPGVTTYSYSYPQVITYTTPSYGYWTPAPVVSPSWNGYMNSASETSNTPQRAGEASTMSGGAPNMSTQN
jgi:hypothetical protein